MKIMTTLGNLEGLLESAKIPVTQAKVYVAGLELGSATLSDVTHRTGLSKTTVFEALNDLHTRKFLRVTRRGKAVTYRMTDPEHVVTLLRQSITEQAAMIDDIARAIPLFTALQGGHKPSTLVYEGVDAIDGYFAHMTSIAPSDIDEIVNGDDVYAWIDEKALLAARRKYRHQPKSGRVLSLGKRRNVNAHFAHRKLNPAWGNFRGSLTLYGSYVSVVTFTTRVTTIIIDSPALADSLRMLFGVAWRASDDL